MALRHKEIQIEAACDDEGGVTAHHTIGDRMLRQDTMDLARYDTDQVMAALEIDERH